MERDDQGMFGVIEKQKFYVKHGFTQAATLKDSMASNTSYDYCGSEDTSAYDYGVARSKQEPRKNSATLDYLSEIQPPVSVYEPQNISPKHISYGVVKGQWKPRQISAKRDFPKAFYWVSMHTQLSVDASKSISESYEIESNKVLDNTKIANHLTVIKSQENCVSPLPKRQKVPLVHEFPKGITGNCKDNVVVVESEASSMGTEMFSLKHEDTNLSSTDEVIDYPERRVSAVRCYPPGCGRNAKPLSEEEIEKAFIESKEHWLTCESCNDHESDINTIIYEDNDTYEQFNSQKRRVSAVRCFPPGCGPDAAPLSEEDLKEAIAESKKHWLNCNSCGCSTEWLAVSEGHTNAKCQKE